MSMFVVVIVDHFVFPAGRIEVRGLYPDAEEAERARRRHHLDIALDSPFNHALTYVREVGPS